MKRSLLLAIVCWFLTVCLEAAPALRKPFTVKQPDGTTLTIGQFGDEWHHWTATTDGTIVIATDKGYCIAQIDEQGRLSETDVLAHEPACRSSEEQAAITQQAARRDLFHEQGRKAPLHAVPVGNAMYLPHLGSPRVLTILAAFQDVDFIVNNPAEAFNQFLNGERQEELGNQNQKNLTSVRQYFEISSRGQFSPHFDVVGPVTLPHNLDFYGGRLASGADDNTTGFFSDALEKAKEQVSDWSVYDSDEDGVIELVCIIFAGFGQNQGGDNNTIWAKSDFRFMKLDDDTRVARFSCSPELLYPELPDQINGIGVFTHEFSHCMGLPDLYASTAIAYKNNQSMESWDIMDYGLYLDDGYAPCAYTAWEQEAMGWTEIEDVGTIMPGGSCQLDEVLPLIEGGKAYKLVNTGNDRDFIVMENIQQRGLNLKADGHGLLVYHVDYPNEKINIGDTPNNVPGHPAVAVVPASGQLINSYLATGSGVYSLIEWKASIAASSFPGTQEVTSLNDQMGLPNYCFYDGNNKKPVGFMLSNITEQTESGGVSLTITSAEVSGIFGPRWEVNDEKDPVYDLQGRRIHGSLKPGIYVSHGKKMLVK